MDPRATLPLPGESPTAGRAALARPQMTPALGEKVRRFVALSMRADDGGSGGSENSESSESSESSENSESSESSESKESCEGILMQTMLVVDPQPDEWGLLLGAAERTARQVLTAP